MNLLLQKLNAINKFATDVYNNIASNTQVISVTFNKLLRYKSMQSLKRNMKKVLALFRLHLRLGRCCVEFSCSMGLFRGRILITMLAVSLRRLVTSAKQPISLFWAPNGLNELPEVRFELPFILIGKSTMALLTGQSWRILKSWYTGGGLKQGFRRCFADGLNQSLVLSAAQATKKRCQCE